MKTILVAKFVLEANENIPHRCDLSDVSLHYGQECIDRLQFGDVFDRPNVRLIPAIYADAASNGVMKRSAFEYIERHILNTVKAHIHEIDGIYLHLHGASEIEGLGSGDHHILKEVRRITGPYLPIAVVCDPHGNLCQEYVESTSIIRSYRESPHTDIEPTIHFVCQLLLELLEHRRRITPVYRKLPMILGGEQSVSTDEPVRSINHFLNELEKDPRILSASWHVGYIRHDTETAGCGIVVIPYSDEFRSYAEEKADEVADYVWMRRHEFHYTGVTAVPDKALEMVLESTGKPAFLNDSGDNVTSGALGANTAILRQVLGLSDFRGKRFLFASIHDKEAYAFLASKPTGTSVTISLGAGYDALSEPVELETVIRHIGRQRGTKIFGEEGDFGGCVTISVAGVPVDIIVCDTNHPFVERQQVLAAGTDWMDYDIVVVKTGYAFPEPLEQGEICVMSLTEGATLQDTARLPFRRIMRPMFPIDDI